MPFKKITIAIDGPSSSGKSSFARALAKRLDYIYIDTGAMYRAVTLFAMRSGLIDANGSINETNLITALTDIKIEFRHNAAAGTNETFLNAENVEREIRQMEVSAHVSSISAISGVRNALVWRQQQMSVGGGVVMDGRDVGTVVMPNADLKIFLNASPQVRARRRYEELRASGDCPDYAAIENNICARDLIDRTRADSPLRQAPDAILLDNSAMTPTEQMQWVMRIIKNLTQIADTADN